MLCVPASCKHVSIIDAYDPICKRTNQRQLHRTTIPFKSLQNVFILSHQTYSSWVQTVEESPATQKYHRHAAYKEHGMGSRHLPLGISFCGSDFTSWRWKLGKCVHKECSSYSPLRSSHRVWKMPVEITRFLVKNIKSLCPHLGSQESELWWITTSEILYIFIYMYTYTVIHIYTLYTCICHWSIHSTIWNVIYKHICIYTHICVHTCTHTYLPTHMYIHCHEQQGDWLGAVIRTGEGKWENEREAHVCSGKMNLKEHIEFTRHLTH